MYNYLQNLGGYGEFSVNAYAVGGPDIYLAQIKKQSFNKGFEKASIMCIAIGSGLLLTGIAINLLIGSRKKKEQKQLN